MKRWSLLCLATLVLAPLAACSIPFGSSDDDDVCTEPPTLDQGHRNPHNGQCEPFGGGTCAETWAFEAPVAFDWGDCPSACEQLDEPSCLASPECHATYVDCAPGGNCNGPWMFNECWDLPPSGGNYGGEQCEGLDAESCNRNADCVSNYHNGDSGDSYPSGGGPLSYDSCAPEGGNFGGCFSQADCADGTVCTAETECLPPPGCLPGQVCPDVCFGHCVPTQDSCAAVDCAPGYHCEELCGGDCDPENGTCMDPTCTGACVPDTSVCPIDCPMGTECVQVCADCDPADPMCTGECTFTCVPTGPDICAEVDCMPGAHCEDQCTVNADGTFACHAVCVPDGGNCGIVPCGPGEHCEQTCTPPQPGCMGGPMGCPPVCTSTCQPDAPGACEMQTDEMACQGQAGCEPVYIATCTMNPDGTFDCGGFMFVRCEREPAIPPMPMP